MSRIAIDPQLRGRVTPSVLDRMARAGLHVHQVGSAAYVHTSDRRHRWLLVVTPAPSSLLARIAAHHRWLIGRGNPTALQARRQESWARARRRLRLRAPSGRFAGAVPWWADVDDAGRLTTPRNLQPWRLS